jgi:3-oxoacyl-[acyl-carrier protein] reductase
MHTMDLGLQGRAVIVTGASRGIGRATTRALTDEGASVLAIGRDRDALEATAQECNGRVETLSLDVTDPSAGEKAVEACRRAFDRLDGLVNGAGTSSVRAIDALTDAEWQAQWELHVMAPMHLMRAAVAVMVDRGWGRIVNLTSSSGKRPSSTNAAYSVTKAAQLSLSRAYADAYAKDGVLVNAVAPGPIGGDLWLAPGGLADQNAQAKGTTREEVLAATAGRVPLQRLGTEEEIAAVIVFLCSAAASNVVGAAWSVDGGSVPVII